MHDLQLVFELVSYHYKYVHRFVLHWEHWCVKSVTEQQLPGLLAMKVTVGGK